MEEGRKRVLAIVAGILVARHLKTLKICMTLALAPGLNLSSPAQSNGRTESCGESTGSISDEFDYEDRNDKPPLNHDLILGTAA